jgi:hypothetical protein
VEFIEAISRVGSEARFPEARKEGDESVTDVFIGTAESGKKERDSTLTRAQTAKFIENIMPRLLG